MRGKFTSGIPTAVEGRVNLKLGGISLTSKNSSSIASLQVSGITGINVAGSFSFVTLIEPSVSYITFGRQDASLSALTKANGSVLAGTGSLLSFHARIPIEGWENSNLIVAQLSGLESCTDTYQCTDSFSGYMNSSGTITTENVDFISGNCTRSGTNSSNFSCTFRSGLFTVQPVCTAQTDGSPTNGVQVSSSSTTFSGTTFASGAFAATGVYFTCQKQGADYIGKTAKAVASDQNLRTPSVTNAVFISAEISSAGVVSQEDSDFINGSCAVTDTSLYTCTWVSGYWASAPKCMPNITNGSQNFKAEKEAIPTTSSGIFRTANSTTGAKAASGFTLFCHGVKL